MYEIGKIIQGEIKSLAFGGKGILRTPDRMVVFVPFTAPKDHIECRLVQVKKNYAIGELTKLIAPSPDRISPRCPYFGECGGCQLQHLNYSAQAEYKKNSAIEALRKVYPNAAIQMNPANVIWEYRRHITLTMEPIQRGFKAGYITLDNTSILEVRQCPIFTSKNPIFETIAGMVSQLNSSKTKYGKVKVIKDNGNYHLVFNFDVIPSNFDGICKPDGSILSITGISPKNTMTFGNPQFSIEVDGVTFSTQAGIFLQNHAEISQSIYREVKQIILESSPEVVLDLYCGIGISSILAAPFAKRIYAVEWDKRAIELAKKNAASRQISNIEFEAKDVALGLNKLLKKKPQIAIVNPPRIGLTKEVVEMLGSSSLKELIYISCQPATLARDLNYLQKANFTLEKACAFDMFPQTGHVETLVYIKRLYV